MKLFVAMTASAIVSLAVSARADYDTHPELRPESRCGMIPPGIGDPKDPGGVNSNHCQRLIWDLPATTQLGAVRVGAPFIEDRIPRFPLGVTDRIPPIYILDANDDRVSDDGKGYEKPGPGRKRLCADPDHIPYWKELLQPDGSPKIGTDVLGRHSVDDPTKPQTGPLLELACRRGSRSYMGPWQTGTDDSVFDRGWPGGNRSVRFENTERLNRDVAAGRTTEAKGEKGLGRVEWNVGEEFYNHFGSHHAICYNPSVTTCSDPANPQSRQAYDPADPKAACRSYQDGADGPDDPMGQGKCWSGSRTTEDSDCVSSQAYRAGTQQPGRHRNTFAAGRGMLGTEDQLWGCNHHAVTQLPPGSYSMTKLANYRLQKGGLVNDTPTPIYGVPPGKVIGGTVSELVIQYFTEPANAPIKPINYIFNAVGDLATTAYPPFTWNYHESQWFPPYDAAVAYLTIHSHHRMVKGTMNLTTGPTVRAASPDPNCGGSAGGATPTDLYVGWNWEDAKVCEYWREPDGPVVVRKGVGIRTTCLVNNGVTPEAIKHGLVAGSVVEGLRNAGAPIPKAPETMPSSDWSDLLVGSPIGEQLLYGSHPPLNYRVKYTCGPSASGVSPPTMASPIGDNCSPNPAADADGEYVDGPYRNAKECGVDMNGDGIWCNPGVIRFACVGEEEMCIGVGTYYALPRIGGAENDEAMKNLEDGNVDGVGTPGATRNMDIVGICHDCPAAAGL